jgi:hypothetical protein
MKQLVGKPAVEVIAQGGPPNEKTSDGQDGEIWTYFVQRQWTTPGHASTTYNGTANAYLNQQGSYVKANVYGNTTTTWTPPETQGYTGYRMFFLDKNGLVYRWAWRGL